MIDKPRLPRTLDAQMIYTLILALALALAMFFAVYGSGCYAVRHIYMSEENVAARKTAIYNQFSSYVADNKLSSLNGAELALWSEDKPEITILLYRNQKLYSRIRAGMTEAAFNMLPSERTSLATLYGKLYPVRFADGVMQIAIGDYSENLKYTGCRIVAVSAAALTFLVMMLWYVRQLTQRIVVLSKEAVEIGAGDLEKPITVSGGDELAELAASVDLMRRSVIERMGSESRAWQANAELITAISHDIRTPMTSLIGYLGLLNEGGFTDSAQEKQFAASAYAKAMDLKDLTDELFKYFLVFGKSGVEMEIEPYDARLLTEQFLAEAQFDIADSGFTLEVRDFEGECSISVDPLYLKRVFDNLVSNIKKYADPSHPVTAVCELADGSFSVCVSNAVSRSMNKVESTKIGLRTCERILETMGGKFKTDNTGDWFTAELILPAGAPLEQK